MQQKGSDETGGDKRNERMSKRNERKERKQERKQQRKGKNRKE